MIQIYKHRAKLQHTGRYNTQKSATWREPAPQPDLQDLNEIIDRDEVQDIALKHRTGNMIIFSYTLGSSTIFSEAVLPFSFVFLSSLVNVLIDPCIS
jgi:hypothetical protein